MTWRPDMTRPYVRAFADRARVDCENLFEFECPKYWGELRVTPGNPSKRHCDACDQPVYLVTAPAELRARARRGECVAVILQGEVPATGQGVAFEDGGEPPRLMLGRPSLAAAWTPTGPPALPEPSE